MKKIFLFGLLIATTFFSFGQKIDEIINAKEVERIERTLSSDDMRGRRAFTPDIDRAADFITNEFKSIGLQTWNNAGNYKQEFAMVRSKIVSVTATVDGTNLDPKNIAIVSCRTDFKIDQSSGYEIATIKAGGNLFREISAYTQP